MLQDEGTLAESDPIYIKTFFFQSEVQKLFTKRRGQIKNTQVKEN